MPITATYIPLQFKLSVLGTVDGDAIAVSRDLAGTLLVNGGAVPVTGGTATVANTDLVEVVGSGGNDVIALDEANGALPAADLYGGDGVDSLTGGSAADTLHGDGGDDTLIGKGGSDLLYGGTENDTLVGGDGDDQMFGEDGNDRMIWNPGDDTDLMEGGIGSDTAEVNGGGGAEAFTVTANGLRVRFDRVDPAPFMLDIGTTETLWLKAGGGDDTISTSGNLAALIALTLDGGLGNDTILGGNGADALLGGDGNDFVDGQQGNDAAHLGAGDDVFQWDPGDGSDTIEGGADADELLFNGSAANEIFALVANGAFGRLTRNIGNIVMDTNDLETFTINALGGTDTVTVSNLAGTDATAVAIDLAGTIGGVTGDALADVVVVEGSDLGNAISVTGAGSSFSVSGLATSVTVTNSEGANDSLVVNGLGGNDEIIATPLPAGVVKLTVDGGAGNDTIRGSQGADVFLGGDGGDFVFGDNGNDVAFLGAGADVFEWNPGDGNDVVEGQADHDELRFVGSNASENIDIAANGGRLLFLRDVANVTMDMDDVERIRFNALGGADNIVVGDLSGTDAGYVDVHLEAAGGGGDGALDTVTASGTNAADVLAVASAGGVVSVGGVPWTVSVFGAEAANDRLVVNGLGSDDVIDAGSLAGGLIALTLNGGLGGDVFIGSGGDDLVNGGDGNDTALLGAGADTFVWNPGDDNDTIEGQSGTDTLRFNGANVAETITISANGGRALFFRDVANVLMDLNDTEVIHFSAVGGTDSIIVNDLSATDVTQIVLDLAATAGGGAGDLVGDNVVLNAGNADNPITLSGASLALLTVTGLPATVTISQFEATLDSLSILALGGNDNLSATGLVPHIATLTLDGGAGNDVIRSNGDGIYFGGIGDDTIFAGLTNSLEAIDGGAGIDTLDTTTWGGLYTINMVTGVTNYSGESFLNFENLTTGAGDDTITGTGAANTIATTGGIDNVSAGAGDDIVSGGAGADSLDGGADFDSLDYRTSGAGVTVSLAAATASGGDATGDVFANFEGVFGSELADSLTGNALANLLIGNGGADSLFGLGGNDTLHGSDGGDAIDGGAGQDALLGGAGGDFLLGGADNDLIDGGTGTDNMIGGTGDDTYYVDVAGDLISEAAGEGFDRAISAGSYELGAGSQVEVMQFADLAGTSAFSLYGSDIANTIYGNAGGNVLAGGGGADYLVGLGGHDTLYGGDGADALEGGAGQDVLLGGAGNDYLVGGADADLIQGDAGTDNMVGGAGDDVYYVDNTGDAVTEAAGEGTDRVISIGSFELGAASQVEIMQFADLAGTGALFLYGSDIANSIYGNAGNNVLSGGGGADYLVGLGGADTLYGGAAVDTIDGGAGSDVLYGGAGADYLVGGADGDYFAFFDALGGGNVDQIADMAAGSDKIALDNAVFAGLALGALAAGAFVAGTAAGDADDRVIYSSASGQLWFDADGTGAGAAVLFATVTPGTALTGTDFVVF